MPRLLVHHRSTYRYAEPVGFGDHHFHLRPRESFDQRLRAFHLHINPRPLWVRFRHDPLGNAVGRARFSGVATLLSFDCRIEVDQQLVTLADLAALDAPSRRFPPDYPRDELPDLAPFMAPAASARAHHAVPDPLADWVNALVRERAPVDAVAFLHSLTDAIRYGFAYNRREERGIQPPAETLALARGTCRDFAQLFVAAARCRGFAARFVSGYVGARSATADAPTGGGATHAWAQVYLPDAGWIDFDPTNALVGNAGLVRVACVRDPGHALPLWGSYYGAAGLSLGLEVDVTVRTVDETATEPPQRQQVSRNA